VFPFKNRNRRALQILKVKLMELTNEPHFFV
jgi:hypothetical protein